MHKHNPLLSSEYATWKALAQRCYNSKHKNYKYYGARGIAVCERWLTKNNGFANFLIDMGTRPKDLTLERIDNEKGYSKKNCKWATRKEQRQNTRPNSCGPNKQHWFYGHGPSGEMIIENNQGKVARFFGLNQSNISRCLRNETKSYKKWTFQKI